MTDIDASEVKQEHDLVAEKEINIPCTLSTAMEAGRGYIFVGSNEGFFVYTSDSLVVIFFFSLLLLVFLFSCNFCILGISKR